MLHAIVAVAAFVSLWCWTCCETSEEDLSCMCASKKTVCAVQVAAVSTAGRAYVWSCSAAEEDRRITGSLTMRVSVEASSSETCVPLCNGQEAVHVFEVFFGCHLLLRGKDSTRGRLLWGISSDGRSSEILTFHFFCGQGTYPGRGQHSGCTL